MRSLRGLGRGERASVAMEFALFLPVFLLLVFGIVELGSAWYYKQMLVTATREGARSASLLNDATNGTSQVISEVTNFLHTAGFPGTVSVSVAGADGNAGAQVTVTATSVYQLPVLGHLVPHGLSNVSLHAATVMRHE